MVIGGSAEELCGLLYGEQLLGIDNVAPNRCAEYAMDTAQQLEAMKARGWPDAIWHTHPGGTREPSSIDLATAPAGVRMSIACCGWIGTWLDGHQVQEAWMSEMTNETGEVSQGEDGQWYWHVQSANGQVVAEGGEGFTRKADAVEALYRERPDLHPSKKAAAVQTATDASPSGDPGASGTGGGSDGGYTAPTPPGSGVGSNSAGVGPTTGGPGVNSSGVGPTTTT
jgi:proteasome lid subunit RPN8/RPN11